MAEKVIGYIDKTGCFYLTNEFYERDGVAPNSTLSSIEINKTNFLFPEIIEDVEHSHPYIAQIDSKGFLHVNKIVEIAPPPPAEIVFGATVGDNTLHLRTQTAGFDCTIDWGDGSKTVCPANGGNITHSYVTAGDYSIKISGKSFAGFYVNYQTGREKYKELISMGKWEIDTMTSCEGSLKNCHNLTKIHADAFKYATKITSLKNCFSGCSITEIPSGLFDKNTAVTNFSSCFYDCSKLTAMPNRLFVNNTAVASFNSCFAFCSSLTSIPNELFTNHTAVTDFGYCFDGCTKLTLNNTIFGTGYANRFLNKSVDFINCFNRTSFTGTQGTAPELWNFNFGTGTPTKTKCFGGTGNSATSLSNYVDIPVQWK